MDNLSEKQTKKKVKLILDLIIWIAFILGFILFINRYLFQILPSKNWIILLNHLIGSFLITIMFYIFFIGLNLFIKSKKDYSLNIKDFILASFVTIITIFCWEGLIQNFRDIYQIIVDFIGLLFSWIYFLSYKKIKNHK